MKIDGKITKRKTAKVGLFKYFRNDSNVIEIICKY
jgi:hypothetical protein